MILFENPLARASFAQHMLCSASEHKECTLTFPRHIIGSAWAISSIQIAEGSGSVG